MGLADLSVRRPVFITSLISLMMVAGFIYMRKLPVDLFPNVTFPVIVVNVPYRGAGPAEIETLVSRPLEDEMSTISGIKRLSSIANEGLGTVIAEFTLETDIKTAEARIRDAISVARRKLPKDIDEPIIRRIDPADQPVIIFSLSADLSAPELFEVADEIVRPQIEQVHQVGLVDILGGRKREIHVNLNQEKLKAYELSASQVVARLNGAGENIPLGKITDNETEKVMRTIGQYKTLSDIQSVVLNFFGNERAITIGDVGEVNDSLKDEQTRAFVNGKPSLFIYVFRQSGSNTVSVVNGIKKKVNSINQQLKSMQGKPNIKIVRDGSTWIRANLTDVSESIMIGIGLAVIVVFLFLANVRSTIITALALPNSLIGAFVLMGLSGFSINIMTLLALSLSVGLLIDDAIVVRENIFRHLEMGKSSLKAALEGTAEVRLAVIATTFAVVAVFGPVAFLQGMVGQFFREFGMTVVFAMLISLFDALTIAPMLSAFFAGRVHSKKGVIHKFILDPFDRLQTWMENGYVRFLGVVLNHPLLSLFISFIVFIGCVGLTVFIPKTFLPPQDAGEFAVGLSLKPGTSLSGTEAVALKIDELIRKNPEVQISAMTIGSRDGEAHIAEIYVRLIPFEKRTFSTSAVKEKLRAQLKEYSYATPTVKDYDMMGAGQRPLMLNIMGPDQEQLEAFGINLLERLKSYPKIKDVDINFRPGKPEYQIKIDNVKAEQMGVLPVSAGQEMRILVDGALAGKFREQGREYDIRVKLREDQRDLETRFHKTFVPNLNYSLVPLKSFAQGRAADGPTKISRQDRSRIVQIQADISPGAGMGEILKEIGEMIEVEMKLPKEMSYTFIGQAENFKELGQSMLLAMILGVLFVYLVLASLYESFAVPFTIMMALPLAVAGSFVSLVIAKESLNIFSWIGMIMLLGVSSKNSILLVDFANQKVAQGWDRRKALLEAGKTRLRPILMTTMALIAGTIPIAIGLNEASRQRVSMGITIIGGLISSTLLTLIVIPAVYSYIDRFRNWFGSLMKRWFMASE